MSQPQLAQAELLLTQHIDGTDFAPLHQRAARQQQALTGTDVERHLDGHARMQAGLFLRQFDANLEAVGVGVGVGEHRDRRRGDPSRAISTQQHTGLLAITNGGDIALGNFHRQSQLAQGQPGDQLLSGSHRLAHLHMSGRDDAREGCADDGVVHLLAGAAYAGPRGLQRRTGGIPSGNGLIHLRLGYQLALIDALDARVFRLCLTGRSLGSAQLRLSLAIG